MSSTSVNSRKRTCKRAQAYTLWVCVQCPPLSPLLTKCCPPPLPPRMYAQFTAALLQDLMDADNAAAAAAIRTKINIANENRKLVRPHTHTTHTHSYTRTTSTPWTNMHTRTHSLSPRCLRRKPSVLVSVQHWQPPVQLSVQRWRHHAPLTCSPSLVL